MKLLLKINKFFISKHIRKFCSSKLKPPWNVLFLGSDKFSLASLSVLHSECQVENNVINKLEVVTTSRNNVVYKFAQNNGLKVHSWPLNNEFIDKRTEFDFHIGLVVSFGRLIPKHLIDAFPMGMINVHASLLPRWRGAAPIIHAIAAGDEETGVTIMKIRPHKFDIGEIIHQQSIKIPNFARMPELHETLATIGAENLLRVLKQCPHILSTALPQNVAQITNAPKITPEMAHIDFNRHSARDLFNLSRALTGFSPLLLTFNEKLIKIHNISNYIEDTTKVETYGKVEYLKDRKLLQISVKNGWILVDSISISGKKTMNASEFHNGFVRNTNVTFSCLPTSISIM